LVALDRYTISHSFETLAELRDVLSRDKFKTITPIHERLQFCDNIAKAAQIIEPAYQFQVFQDRSDDKFFSLAYSAGAECIISGDAKHIRTLKHLHGIQIWSPAQFLVREIERKA
jgi:putative PIN family toxin of toxin-antitoxin system